MSADVCRPCTAFRFPGRRKRLGEKRASAVCCDGFWLWFMPDCATHSGSLLKTEG